MADIQKALELQTQGKIDEAKEIYLEFLDENPKQPDVSNLVGLICLQKEELDDAIEHFQAAIEGFPCAEFYQNLGTVYYKKKDFETAMQNFEKAVEFESENLEFIRNFAQMAKDVKQIDYAIKFYEKSLSVEPKDTVGWNNLGLLYEKKHDYEKAKSCYQNSLKVEKNYEALHNMGVLHRTLRNFDASIDFLKHALKLRPNHNETMISLGMSYLSKKDFQNGYKYYKYMKPEVREKYRNFWDGKKHPESTLLVFYYAGFGDHIMFSRYIPFLKDYFKTIKVWLPPNVSVLMEKNFEGVEFVKSRDVDYDYSVCIMELHYYLGMGFDKIPCSEGYLTVDDKKVQEYKEKYFQTDKKKIGLFWQGNPRVFANRSIKLKELEPLFSLENAEFYSLEKDDEFNQIVDYPNIIDLGKTFETFEDTAAAMKNLDYFVTIDSSVLHLAGALGVKTCLLLPYSSEWRWFKETEKTDWYDSVRIFKQKEQWDWQEPVEKVCDFLKNTL